MDNIGKKVNELRKLKNMTLKDLSAQTGLSVSFLSQFERGQSSATLDSLEAMAESLDMPLSELISLAENRTAYLRSPDVQRQKQLVETYTAHTRLSGQFEGRRLEAFIYELAPGEGRTESYAHHGEEFYYILEGKAIFHVGSETYELTAHETIHFPSSMPHSVLNAEKGVLRMLSVMTPAMY